MPWNPEDAGLETRFAAEIKRILGEVFITKDVNADLEEATDFAIFNVKPFKIGVRLRRYDYFKFNRQITIRWSRPSGVKTEIHKIKEGLVQYIFYGFLDECETRIIQYVIVEAEVFKEIKPYQIKPNNPPDSELAIYNLSQIPGFFIVKFWKEEASTRQPFNPASARTGVKLGEFL